MNIRIFQKVENILERTLEDEFILVNTNTNQLIMPSPEGRVIWNLIDGKLTEDEIISKICEYYGMDRNESSQDSDIPDAIGEVISAPGESVCEQVSSFLDLLIENELVKIIIPDS